ncbi:response regulator transcription factor [Microvirga sp. ACRRW]|uniref:response regulator transcription factor n=1 Tax=Microvirga sp. ACRRW TaxID=2918205 RepID=UPI001EF6C878|nr:response regulator transcription factor [Microvirga sp. ACRRW]MCG7394905.1 response regulator transcription factor [Microvirga sp. ACRRW]
MRVPYATPRDGQDSSNKEGLVIIDDEPFLQECLVEAIHSALPHTPVFGISSIEQLDHINNAALVMLRIHTHPVSGCQLASQTRAIVQHCPNTPIVLSMCMNALTLEETLALGVRGIIPASTSFKVAVAALQLVMVGGTYYPYLDNGDLQDDSLAKSANGRIMDSSSPLIVPHSLARPYLTVVEESKEAHNLGLHESNVMFTARELEVLEALQKGWSNKWIAHSLCISENTIKVHVQRIMRKLHATNRTEAVVRHRQLTDLR